MRNHHLLFSALVILALSLAACGGLPTEDLTSSEQAIINGVPDTDPGHAGVVGIIRRYKDLPAGWSFCSGSMIAPGVVMTAAHCTRKGTAYTYTVVFGAEAGAGDERPVTALWVHPGWDEDLILNDIALMRFSGGAPAGVETLPYLSAEMEPTEEHIGEMIRFVGYGRTETGTIFSKLTTTNFLALICNERGDCDGQGMLTKEKSICYFAGEGEGATCSGDSGGPWMLYRDGVEYVGGVTSYHVGSCAGGYHCGTNVALFADLVAAFIAADAKLGEPCEEDLDCLSARCADGVCCNYSCDGPCEACNLAGMEGSCSPISDSALEAGCGKSGGGCNSAPRPVTGPFWPGMSALVLFFFVFFLRNKQ